MVTIQKTPLFKDSIGRHYGRSVATKRERVRVRIGVNDEMVSVTWNAVLELEVGHGAQFPHVLTVRVPF